MAYNCITIASLMGKDSGFKVGWFPRKLLELSLNEGCGLFPKIASLMAQQGLQ